MAQQTINIGAVANDGTGDDLRTAGDKINDNFTELYASLAGLLELKGDTDCSANPNYPAALKGDAYYVTVAGKIGGASGKSVDVGDVYVAKADNAGGTEASVGTSWFVLEHNLAGVLPLTGGTLTGDLIVPDEAYDATNWNGSLEVPTKNAVRDKIEALGGGGGSAWTHITTWTYSINVTEVDFTNLGIYSELLFIARNIVLSGSSFRVFRLSVDNGSTFYSASGDYASIAATGTPTNATDAAGHSTSTSTGQTVTMHLMNNVAGVHKRIIGVGAVERLFLASTAVVDAVRFLAIAGNITAGTIQVMGRLA